MRRFAVVLLVVVIVAGALLIGVRLRANQSTARSGAGTATTTHSSSSSAAVATPAPSHFQALVHLPVTEGSALSLYDSSTNSLTTLLPSVSDFTQAQFAGDHAFAYANGNAVVVRDFATGHEQPLVTTQPNFNLVTFGVGADGASVAYLQSSGSTHKLTLHNASGDRDLAALAPPGVGEGSPYDQTFVSFSPDGRYILMVDTLAGGSANDQQKSRMQVRDLAGNLVYAGEDTGAFPQARQALWSPVADTVYFDDSGGVEMLDVTTGTKTALVDTAWTWPSISPDGKLLAYTTVISHKIAVQVYDLAKRHVVFTRFNRSHPHFLSNDTVCYLEESPTTRAPLSLAGTEPTGRVLAYDFTTQDVVNLPFADLDPTYVGSFDVTDVRGV